MWLLTAPHIVGTVIEVIFLVESPKNKKPICMQLQIISKCTMKKLIEREKNTAIMTTKLLDFGFIKRPNNH